MHARHRSRVRHAHHGFTVIELLVATLVGAVVLMLAHGFLTSVADAGSRADAVEAGASGRADFYDLLRVTALQIEAQDLGITSFAGDASAGTFMSACLAASGWTTPCNVQISVRREAPGCRAELAAGGERVVWTAVATSPCRLRYLQEADGGGVWRDRWTNASAAPPAFGLLIGADSMIFRTGRRG